MDDLEHVEAAYLSPLKLLSGAYTDEQPVFAGTIQKYYQALDACLVSLSRKDRESVFRLVYSIYTEKERMAFAAGVRTGFRLLRELEGG